METTQPQPESAEFKEAAALQEELKAAAEHPEPAVEAQAVLEGPTTPEEAKVAKRGIDGPSASVLNSVAYSGDRQVPDGDLRRGMAAVREPKPPSLLDRAVHKLEQLLHRKK